MHVQVFTTQAPWFSVHLDQDFAHSKSSSTSFFKKKLGEISGNRGFDEVTSYYTRPCEFD